MWKLNNCCLAFIVVNTRQGVKAVYVQSVAREGREVLRLAQALKNYKEEWRYTCKRVFTSQVYKVETGAVCLTPLSTISPPFPCLLHEHTSVLLHSHPQPLPPFLAIYLCVPMCWSYLCPNPWFRSFFDVLVCMYVRMCVCVYVCPSFRAFVCR